MLEPTVLARRASALEDVIASEIRPLVREIDEAGVYPEAALRSLGRAGAYAHHAGGEADRGGLPRAIDDTAAVAETCLSTAFCMWCQNALTWYVGQSENTPLRTRLLSDVAAGRRLGGTGLSNPMKSYSGIEPLALSGERAKAGYRVSGKLPWVSNLGPDHLFSSIFSLQDGRQVMAVFDCSDPAVRLSQNARFIALDGTATYSVSLHNVFIPDADVISEDAKSFVPRIRQGFVLLQLGLGIGLARGVAKAMSAERTSRIAAGWLPLQPDEILERADQLTSRAADHAQGHDDPGQPVFLQVLKTRLQASLLAVEAAQAGVYQFGARGYVSGAEISRRQREAQFVAIVTPSVKHITRELARAAG